MEDLLSWRDKGLTGASAEVLFQVVRLNRAHKRAIELAEIVASITDEESEFRSEEPFKPGAIRTTAAKLKKVKWATEKGPYLKGRQNCYEPDTTAFMTAPRQAQLALKIHQAEDYRPDDAQDHTLHFLVVHGYCVEENGRILTTWNEGGRFGKEREYIERLAMLDTETRHALAGSAQQTPLARVSTEQEFSPPDKIEARHLPIIMAAWEKWQAAGLHEHNPTKDEVTFTFDELLKALEERGQPHSSEELSKLLRELDYYQQNHVWRGNLKRGEQWQPDDNFRGQLLEIDHDEVSPGEGFRPLIAFRRNKSISYPETAHFILFLDHHNRTYEAIKQGEMGQTIYRNTFKASLEWSLISGYLVPHPSVTVLYQTTQRVAAEKCYLQLLAQLYDRRSEADYLTQEQADLLYALWKMRVQNLGGGTAEELASQTGQSIVSIYEMIRQLQVVKPHCYIDAVQCYRPDPRGGYVALSGYTLSESKQDWGVVRQDYTARILIEIKKRGAAHVGLNQLKQDLSEEFAIPENDSADRIKHLIQWGYLIPYPRHEPSHVGTAKRVEDEFLYLEKLANECKRRQ